MLPPVETDEKLFAHGVYQQRRAGKITQVREHWSLHSLPDDALIWRSQLLYNNIPLSACYLLRDPDYRPVQMVFFWRWQDGREDLVEYRFTPRYVTVVHGNSIQDVILPRQFELYGWHTVTENFIWLGYDPTQGGDQTIHLLKPGLENGTLLPIITTLEARQEDSGIIAGPNGPTTALSFAIQEANVGLQRLYVDPVGVPLRWELPAEKLTVELEVYVKGDG